mmetsp:Transcript_16700/g.63484  ORF Transcript_16700/g.63484 Transcript_16700/m.63484 type:complete len:117 (+) Transcript_16700:365-715(+)
MQQVSQSMTQVVKGMGRAMKAMNLEKISQTMDEFEKQFEDLDVRSEFMNQAIDNSTSQATPQEEVDGLIQMVADEHGLQLNENFDAVGIGSGAPEQEKEKEPEEDTLESRLAALRK